MSRSAITQKEIADRLGVSVSLVSRVLSGSAGEIGIRQETIDRVLKEAGRQKYAPNPYARALKGRPPKTLGVLIADFEDPFLAFVLHHLQGFSQPNDYTVFVCGLANVSDPEPGQMDAIQTFMPDGVIWLGGGELPDSFIQGFMSSGNPLIHIGNSPPVQDVWQISVDDRDAAVQFYSDLRKRGYRKVAWVSDALPAHKNRLAVFLDVAKEMEFDIRPDWIFRSDQTADAAGNSAAISLVRGFGKDNLPEVIFASGDVIAFGLLHALQSLNIDVPNQVGVVGFDDVRASRFVTPRLTTFAQPVEEMVGVAVNVISSPAESRPAAGITLLRPRLVVRESY